MNAPAAYPAPAHKRGSRKLGDGEFVALMALIMSLQALAIDTMLPALAVLAKDLGVADANRRQLVVGVFLLASGMCSLFPGSLSDRYGRRPVLFVGLAIYIAMTLLCAVATSFPMLLAARVLQAVGSAALTVMPNAIIRDQVSGDRMARLLSMVAVVFMTVPVLAPSLGQALLGIAGWRGIFVAMALLGGIVGVWAWLRLPETLHPVNRQDIHLATILRNMRKTLLTRGSTGYVLGGAVIFGSLFGFVNSAQQLIGEHFGAGTRFPLIFAGCAATMIVANFTNARIVERYGARRVSHGALLLFIAVSAVQVVMAHLPHQTLWQFVPVMAANMSLIGFIGANFGSIALQPFGAIAGAASSVQMFVRITLGAIMGALVGQAYDGTARPLAYALLGGSLACLALVLYSEQGKLFRRVLPPGSQREVGNSRL